MTAWASGGKKFNVTTKLDVEELLTKPDRNRILNNARSGSQIGLLSIVNDKTRKGSARVCLASGLARAADTHAIGQISCKQNLRTDVVGRSAPEFGTKNRWQ